MAPLFDIARLAASGNVHEIFGSGREIPPNYDGVLVQESTGIGLLEFGVYDSTLILQSLADYNGGPSQLYEVWHEIFETVLTVPNLPDPGAPAGRLTAAITMHLRVTDPMAILNNLVAGRSRFSNGDLENMIRDEIHMILDPIVACERRENLFSSSVFHETAGLTVQDYINSNFLSRGLQVERVLAVDFTEIKPATQQSSHSVEHMAGVGGSQQEMSQPAESVPGHNDSSWDSPSQYSSPPPSSVAVNSPENIAAAPLAENAPIRESLSEWKTGLNRNPELSDPLAESGPSLEAVMNRTGANDPSNLHTSDFDAPPRAAKRSPVAENVAMLRRELAKAFLKPEFAQKFNRAKNFKERFDVLRHLDFELLLSDDKISELAQKMTPDQFDFRWVRRFMIEQQSIFDDDQMRQFQKLMATADFGESFQLDGNAAILERPPSAPQPVIEPDSPDQPKHVDLSDIQNSDAISSTEFPKASSTPPGIYKERPDSFFDQAPVGNSTDTGYGGVKKMEDPYSNPPLASASTSGQNDSVNYRDEGVTGGEYGVPEEAAVDVHRIGNIEMLLASGQSVMERSAGTWSLVVINRTSLHFSTLKIGIRSPSLISTGSGQIDDFPPGEKRSIEMRVALRRASSQSVEINFTAVGYNEGGVLPFGLSNQGRITFRSGGFGNEFLVNFEESPNSTLVNEEEMNNLVTDVVETRGSQSGHKNMRLYALSPDPDFTRKLRTRIPNAERGICPNCGNETPRTEANCTICGMRHPGWFAKNPMVLSPELSGARARVERAKFWVNEFSQNFLWVAMGGTLKVGRRHDNDVVLRAFDSGGLVDERRTTELSRLGGVFSCSQGIVSFTCKNRHGVRYRGQQVVCDQEVEIPHDGEMEFLNRQNEAVLTLQLKILFPSNNENTGSTIGPQAIILSQPDDPNRRSCLYLLRSCTFDLVEHKEIITVACPAESVQAIGRLICNEDNLWLEPMHELNLRRERGGEMLSVNPTQILRLDDACRLITGEHTIYAKIFRSRVPVQ